MPNTSQFIFDSYDYKVVTAKIVAEIGDPYWCDTYNNGRGKSISWSICFEGEDDSAEPHAAKIDFDVLPIRVKNWHDLVGYKVQWVEPIDQATGERYGVTHAYEHRLISRGSIRIDGREEAVFTVVASGQNEDGEQFAVNASAEFRGIIVRGSDHDTDDSIHARLKQHIEDSNLSGTPFNLKNKYDSGVGTGESWYLPRDDAAVSGNGWLGTEPKA